MKNRKNEQNLIQKVSKNDKKRRKKCGKMKNVKTHQKWIKANATPKIKKRGKR